MNRTKIIQSQIGFSMIGLLISLVIIGILGSIAVVHYRSLGLYDTRSKSPESFARKLDKTLAYHSLNKLHEMEQAYQVRYQRFGTFDELLQEGYIASGYTAKLEERGVPYLDYWDIQIQVEEESYLLLATPNKAASEFEDVPILAMNETGRIWEEEGFEDIPDATDTDDETPSIFTPEGE